MNPYFALGLAVATTAACSRSLATVQNAQVVAAQLAIAMFFMALEAR